MSTATDQDTATSNEFSTGEAGPEINNFPPKQKELDGMVGPGVEKPQIAEIDKAAANYVLARDRRIQLTAKEVETKEKLIGLLHAHEDKLGRAADGSIRYEFDDNLVELAPTKEKLTVKALADDEE